MNIDGQIATTFAQISGGRYFQGEHCIQGRIRDQIHYFDEDRCTIATFA